MHSHQSCELGPDLLEAADHEKLGIRLCSGKVYGVTLLLPCGLFHPPRDRILLNGKSSDEHSLRS